LRPGHITDLRVGKFRAHSFQNRNRVRRNPIIIAPVVSQRYANKINWLSETC
jgi:hypothetical protein